MELVTGATGYVGGRLVRRLVGEGRAVRAFGRQAGQLAPPALPARGGEVAPGGGAALHGLACVDHRGLRLALLPDPGPTRRAAPAVAPARLAPEPNAAHRRAGRARVPGANTDGEVGR